LHLLRLEMQPLYQDVKICDLALQTEREQWLNYSYIVITQFFSMIYCIGSRCRRVAVVNRKVFNNVERTASLETSNSQLLPFLWSSSGTNHTHVHQRWMTYPPQLNNLYRLKVQNFSSFTRYQRVFLGRPKYYWKF
jgi:hypothetical protein